MSARPGLAERLAAGPPLLLDSAMGTELERRGLALPAPLWSARALIEDPGLVFAVHRENAAAGAELLTANTFRTSPRAVGAAGLRGRARELTALAVSLAQQAAAGAGRSVWVGGSIGPVEDCYRPDLVPSDNELESEHAEHAWNLADAGADLLWIETMNTIRELRIAAEAAAETGLPVAACMVTDGRGSLLSGEPLEEAASAALAVRPAALGVNCVAVELIGEEIGRLAPVAPETPLVAYANILSSGDSPEAYARRALDWAAAGARIVGGCCGTRPEHVAAIGRGLNRSAT